MVVLERDCVDFDIGVVNNNTATAIRKVQIKCRDDLFLVFYLPGERGLWRDTTITR